MKRPFLLLIAAMAAGVLTGCTSATRKAPVASPAAVGGLSKGDGKSVRTGEDDLDEYDNASVADPLEPLNRATFTLNEGIYTVLLRPISRVYKTVVPKPVREGAHNAFENIKFPIRLVNNTLQGNFQRAGQETGKFLVNTVVGVGGVMRPSEGIPALAGVPPADTDQTFAKWGIGHGAYLVLPVLGPSSLRGTVGLAGDYALNPVSWVSIWFGGYAWTLAIPSTNSLRALPYQMDQYDAATGDALDRYLAARSAYIQYRHAVSLR